MSAQRTPFPTL